MRKIIFIILTVYMIGCSDDATGPSKEYPIFHANKGPDVIFIVNEERAKLGYKHLQYVTNVSYDYEGNTYNFIEESNRYPNSHFANNNATLISSNEDGNISIIRITAFLEDDKSIVDSIASLTGVIWYSEFKNSKIEISVNILEVENNEPKESSWGGVNERYGKDKFEVIIYLEEEYIDEGD